MNFECLRDKRANLVFVGLAILDVSGIDTGRVRYLPSNGNVVDLGLVHPEFQHKSGIPTVGSSGNGWEFRRLALN